MSHRNSNWKTLKDFLLRLDPTKSGKVACSKISAALKAHPVTTANVEKMEALTTLLDIYKEDKWSLEDLLFFL
ncbi:expressed conserved protein [Echinococcus multilocularis]|uniref:Expressed conserved protein n=1 Tax=Echinococcus multilocularis TaxID=6211 RepID=A0A068XZK8_ECHMU|nr:expressed conserved protein [Echinococcus multilocularis]